MRTGKTIEVSINADTDLPAFGAYASGTATEGNAQIILNFKLLASACKTDGSKIFKAIIARTLAHELFHVCQELTDQAFSEALVEKMLNDADPEVIECLNEDDMVANLTDFNNHLITLLVKYHDGAMKVITDELARLWQADVASEDLRVVAGKIELLKSLKTVFEAMKPTVIDEGGNTLEVLDVTGDV